VEAICLLPTTFRNFWHVYAVGNSQLHVGYTFTTIKYTANIKHPIYVCEIIQITAVHDCYIVHGDKDNAWTGMGLQDILRAGEDRTEGRRIIHTETLKSSKTEDKTRQDK